MSGQRPSDVKFASETSTDPFPTHPLISLFSDDVSSLDATDTFIDCTVYKKDIGFRRRPFVNLPAVSPFSAHN